MSNDNTFGDFESNYDLEMGHVSEGDRFTVRFIVQEKFEAPLQDKFTTYEVDHVITSDNEKFDESAIFEKSTGIDPNSVEWSWVAQRSFSATAPKAGGPLPASARPGNKS